MSGIFRTTIIPTTHIYQNHLDQLHEMLDEFCASNTNYRWCLLRARGELAGISSIDKFIRSAQPKSLTYKVTSKDELRTLTVTVENGITLYIKNGDYSLNGLYSVLLDCFSLVEIPGFIVFVRRHWLISTFLSVWLIPAMLASFLGYPGFVIFWLVFGLFVPASIFIKWAEASEDNNGDELKWSDVVLTTKIKYETYASRLGLPFFALLTSAKTLISLVAALATIISFVFWVAQ